MAYSKYEVMEKVDDFDRAVTLSTTPEGGTGWTIVNGVTNATPTFATITNSSSGVLKIACDNTNEAEVLGLTHNDILSYDIDQIQEVRWRAKIQSIDNVTDFAIGVASAYNADWDTIAQQAAFRIDGSASTTNIVVETDDGTNNNDDKATGVTLANNTWKEFVIDFQYGTDDVRFYVEDDNGHKTRVAETVTFDMSNYTAGLQPIMQVDKASGTGTCAVFIDKFYIRYKRST